MLVLEEPKVRIYILDKGATKGASKDGKGDNETQMISRTLSQASISIAGASIQINWPISSLGDPTL